MTAPFYITNLGTSCIYILYIYDGNVLSQQLLTALLQKKKAHARTHSIQNILIIRKLVFH
jgi:hypothetical protein